MGFRIEPLAKADIQEQIHFYNAQKSGLGKRFHAEVKMMFKAIQKNPYYQVRYANVRCLPLRKFPAMVHFTYDEDVQCVTVIAVLHTSLDSKNWGSR